MLICVKVVHGYHFPPDARHSTSFVINSLQYSISRALHYASGLSGPTDVLELLINYGADIDANNEECCTPLFFSTQNNNQLAACVLIEQGANVRHKNNQGNWISYTSMNVRKILLK